VGGWRVGRIAGIEIRLDPSVLLIAGLLAFEFWAEVSRRARDFGTSQSVAVVAAILGAALLIGTILAHELAHASACKARGIPVSGITLWMLGGATHAQLESRGPFDEFLVTVVGPGTSLALGAAFLAASNATGGAGDSLTYMLYRLGEWNILLGVFNLLPGFPLDGGRLLRSILWRVTRSLNKATRLAARVGQGLAILFLAVGILGFARTQGIDALWLAFIGWFLYRTAAAALADSQRRGRLESITVRQVMSPPPPTVPADLPVEEALHRYLMGHEGEAFPVVEDGRVVGFVSLATVRGVPLHRPVREAMVGTDGTVQAAPDERLDVVTERLGANTGGTVLVVDQGRLVGVVEPEDVTRFFKRAEGQPGPPSSNGSGPSEGPPELPPRPDPPSSGGTP
jgi:Zn-dependent protease/predicted transcriptional regulator